MLRTTCFRLLASQTSRYRFINTKPSHFNEDKQKLETDFKEFTTIYKFPYIQHLATLNRLKLYQTIATSFCIPATFILNQFGAIPIEAVTTTAVIGISGCLSLYGFGIFSNKLIGFIYLNYQEDVIKVAYIDFWGNRKDVVVPLEDMVPFSDLPVSYTDKLYLKFKRFSVNDTLKMNPHLGQVLDKDKFRKVFSNIYT